MSDNTNNSVVGLLVGDSYEQHTTALSNMLSEVEDKLQSMPVSDVTHYINNGGSYSVSNGLGIRRAKGRWILVYVTSTPKYVGDKDVVIRRVRSRPEDYEHEVQERPLLSCSVNQKTWAAQHLPAFIQHAVDEHKKRARSILNANDTLAKLINSGPMLGVDLDGSSGEGE